MFVISKYVINHTTYTLDILNNSQRVKDSLCTSIPTTTSAGLHIMNIHKLTVHWNDLDHV